MPLTLRAAERRHGRCPAAFKMTNVTKDHYKVGLIQMRCTPEPSENLARAKDMVREAAKKGAHIVCLPELFLTQYFCQREDAAQRDGPALFAESDDLLVDGTGVGVRQIDNHL